VSLRERLAKVSADAIAWSVGAALIVGLICNTYAEVRLSGPWGTGFHFEGWKPRAQRLAREKDELIAAQTKAAEVQKQLLDQAEQDYRDLAKRTDNETDLATQVALGAADRFIAANRVRCPADRGSPGAAPAAAEGGSSQGNNRSGGGAQLDEGTAVDLVAVPAEDIRICTRNTTRLKLGRGWGLDLEKLGAD